MAGIRDDPQYDTYLERVQYAFNKGYTVDLTTGRVTSHRGRQVGYRHHSGYQYIGVYDTEDKVTYKVPAHAFVAYKKFGKKAFIKGTDIRHLNNKKSDNRGDNISYGSRQENLDDWTPEMWERRNKKISLALKGKKASPGQPLAAAAVRKLSEKQVRRIRKKVPTGPRGTAAKLAREFGVSPATICNCLAGRLYQHVKGV